MKRIGAPSIHNGHAGGGARVEAATGVLCPETGWWIPLGNPADRTYVWKGLSMPDRGGRHVDWLLASANPGGPEVAAELHPTPTHDLCLTWVQGIWPDCLD